ncbi:MAG: ABC transporter permease, partial [Acidobacteriota bacterium]
MSAGPAPAGRWITRLYGLCLWLLPPSVRRRDGAEMVELFDALWRDSRGIWPRLRLLSGAFGRLPSTALAEWWPRSGRHRPGQRMPPSVHSEWYPLQAARTAARSLARAPGFSAAAVALVALGIATTTAIFVLVDHVLLRPLPYPEPERLVFVAEGENLGDRAYHSGPVLEALRTIDAVDGWALGHARAANLTGLGTPAQVTAAVVSADFFQVLGATPALGRLFDPGGSGGADQVVLSYAAWAHRFGADPGVLGQTLRIETEPVQVVGVLSPDFHPPQALTPAEVDVWRPIDWHRPTNRRIDAESLQAVARLADGVSLEQAQVHFDRVAAEMAALHPDRFFRDGRIAPLALVPLHRHTVAQVRTELYALGLAGALLLLIAALNVAHLFL